jgi:hypothetical protein
MVKIWVEESEEAGSSFFILLPSTNPFSSENIEVKGYSIKTVWF